MVCIERDYKGTKRWYNDDNDLHREDGPAVVYPNGSKIWYVNNKLHREDGPAIIWHYETGIIWKEEWHLNGKLYRKDGPTCLQYDTDGGLLSEGYYISQPGGGRILHRKDGPAHTMYGTKQIIKAGVTWCNWKYYYFNGQLHREDGPAEQIAMIEGDPLEYWHLNDNPIPEAVQWITDNNYALPLNDEAKLHFMLSFA